MKISKTNSEFLRGAFALINNGQTTYFNIARLTNHGNIVIHLNNGIGSVLDAEVVAEVTQLMIDNGIVISKESDKVGV
jgi:hypothetical protein